MTESPVYPCPVCQIGYCQPGQKTYTRLHRGLFISVPDMPVWMCDICQHEEFDRDAILQLEALLGLPEADQPRKIQTFETLEPPIVRRVKS